jgi:4-diphosphocytidyl-2-C-methyl-D-erythritol kinase
MTSITLTAPAKVNLFLKILNKRKDGYHNISTLFERISLADTITITKRPSGITVSSDKFITRNPKDNLVYKAAELILKHARVKSGVRIYIKKNIPIAAGLGGGSSDAASVLMGLNSLFRLKLKEGELAALGKKLGADVPFFLLQTPFAIGREKGDVLSKINCKARLWHLIIYPGFKLSTKDIYEAFDLLTIKMRDVKIPRSLNGTYDYNSLERMLYNDLEHIAIAKKMVLGRIVERLASYLGRKAIVSGSGPSVFCLCRTRKEAMAAKRELFRKTPAGERKSWQVLIAGTKI